jgi:ABC-type nitrate/sulfonate/bicarbonate transport system substrate-binding protein
VWEEPNVQRKHRNEHRRRWRWRVAAFALLFAGWAHPMAAAEVTHFKVGISEPVNTVLALWMAQAGGFYAAEGLDVEIISMNG